MEAKYAKIPSDVLEAAERRLINLAEQHFDAGRWFLASEFSASAAKIEAELAIRRLAPQAPPHTWRFTDPEFSNSFAA